MKIGSDCQVNGGRNEGLSDFIAESPEAAHLLTSARPRGTLPFIPADFTMKPPKTSCDPMKEKETIPSVPQTRANQNALPKRLLHHDA